MTSLFHWLLEQKDRKGPIGDLARDAATDRDFPRAAGTAAYPTYLIYLTSCNSSEGAVAALREAWTEWSGEAPPDLETELDTDADLKACREAIYRLVFNHERAGMDTVVTFHGDNDEHGHLAVVIGRRNLMMVSGPVQCVLAALRAAPWPLDGPLAARRDDSED